MPGPRDTRPGLSSTGQIGGFVLEHGAEGEVGDRRVRRTRDALRRALVELILENGFEATTVSQITERAQVGRSTFYAHYADKEDLLQGSIEGLRDHLQERVEAAQNGPGGDVHPALAFCLPMLEHADQNRALFAAMVGRRGGELLQELVHDMWADFLRRHWDDADELAVQAVAGAFGSMLTWWLTSSVDLTPHQVDRRFRDLVEPALRASAAGPDRADGE